LKIAKLKLKSEITKSKCKLKLKTEIDKKKECNTEKKE